MMEYKDAESLALKAIHDADGRGLVGRGRNHLHQRVARSILQTFKEGSALPAQREVVDVVYPDPRDALIAEMREALEWYAEHVGNCRKNTNEGDASRRRLDGDCGERARAVLAKAEKIND